MGSEISSGLILLSHGPHGKRYTLIQETCGLQNLRYVSYIIRFNFDIYIYELIYLTVSFYIYRNNFLFVHRMMCGLERTLKDEVQQY